MRLVLNITFAARPGRDKENGVFCQKYATVLDRRYRSEGRSVPNQGDFVCDIIAADLPIVDRNPAIGS